MFFLTCAVGLNFPPQPTAHMEIEGYIWRSVMSQVVEGETYNRLRENQ